MPKERPQCRSPLARQDDRGIDVRLGRNRVQQTVDPRVREHVALVDWKLLPKLDALFERMARETGTYQELLEAGRLKPNQQKDRDIIDDLIS